MKISNFVLISLFIFILSVAAVSAADVNNTKVTPSSHDDSLAVENSNHDTGNIYKISNDVAQNSVVDYHKFDLKLNSSMIQLTDDNIVYNFPDIVDYHQSDILTKDNVNLWASNSSDLKNIFNFISKNNPSWNVVNITLAPNTVFKVNYNTYKDAQFSYGLRLAGNTMMIKGSEGSVIEGDNQKNNFMYIAPEAKLVLYNVNLKSFNHCLINAGTAYAVNSVFSNNKFNYEKKTKQDYRKDIYGAVIANYNNAWFQNCTFINNQAKYDNGGCWGSILHGVTNSLTYFDRCTFKNCGDNFIYAHDYSTVVMIQDHKLNKELQHCYFDKTSCLCAISTNILNDSAEFTGEINCSNVEQLEEAFYTVNSLLPNSDIVINLQPGIYEISKNWIGNNNKPRSLDWRNEVHHPSVVYKSNDAATDLSSKYALDVGVVPITINGNGATIKISGNDGALYHFANIAYGGVLTVNDVTLSNFNHIFDNFGTVYMNNCVFDNNYARGGHIIVNGEGCSNYFSNCTFKQCKAIEDCHATLFDIKDDSYLNLDNCDFSDFFKTNKKIGNVYSSTVEGLSYLKNKINLDSDSVFYNTDDYVVNDTFVIEHGGIMNVDIMSADYLNKLSEAISSFSPNTLIMNFTIDCVFDLNKLKFNGNIIVNGNNHNILFKSAKVGKYVTLTVCNLTFSNYKGKIFDVDGTVNLLGCTFIDNEGKYLIDNKGSCNIVNCSFIGNKLGNNLVDNNKGSLSLNGCHIEGCSCNDVLFYNYGGNIKLSNLTFMRNVFKEGRIVCNYQTSNCEIFNSSNIHPEFKQPITMATWKKIAIRAGIGVAVTALSAIGGYFIGYFLAAYLHPVLSVMLGGVFGAGVGISGGLLDDLIIGGYEHDHSNKWTVVGIYAGIGALAGAVGAGIGAQKYLNHDRYKNMKTIVSEPDSIRSMKDGSTIYEYSRNVNGQEVSEIRVSADPEKVSSKQVIYKPYTGGEIKTNIKPVSGIQSTAPISSYKWPKPRCWFFNFII